jgi:hypothetical protein
MKILNTTIVVVLSILAVACGSSSSSDDDPETGLMSLDVTDAPIDDASSVVVQFSEVQIRGEDESQNIDFIFDPPKSIDLLTLQGSETEELFTDEPVPAGTYNEIRLIINAEEGTEDTYIVLEEGGAQHDMTVPSGSQSGLKVKGSFMVPANSSADFTLDFDVRKSIVQSGNPSDPKYHLKPVLRIVDNSEVGHIAGTVDAALLTLDAGCSDDDVMTHNAVYVFEGSGVTADDIDGDSVEPVVTALVEYDSASDTYSYEAGFLVAGDYTVSFTCNVDAEDVEADDVLQFVGSQDVPVTAGATSTANF